jgi:hypothetical protein
MLRVVADAGPPVGAGADFDGQPHGGRNIPNGRRRWYRGRYCAPSTASAGRFGSGVPASIRSGGRSALRGLAASAHKPGEVRAYPIPEALPDVAGSVRRSPAKVVEPPAAR